MCYQRLESLTPGARRVICEWQHVLYTEPAEPVAGEKVTVYYNNKNTNLDWAEEVWLRAGFNRWTHEKPLDPIKMTPSSGGGPHLEAEFVIPKVISCEDC